MPLYRFSDARFHELDSTTFGAERIRERFDLQAALRNQIEVICPECLVLSEEFGDWQDSRRRIDLLALDRSANLVVVELKRNDTGEHMDLQAVRYAAMVSTLTFRRAVEIMTAYLAKRGIAGDAEQTILGFLGWEEPLEDDFAAEVSITLVAADFSKELTTAVMWLNERGLDIRCVRLVPYRHNDDILLDVEQLIPLPEAQDYQVKIREQSDERRVARRSDRDYTRYSFMGKTYNKRKLVLAVIKEWVRLNEPATLERLTEAFPQELHRGHLFDPLSEARATYEKQQIGRHFLEDDEVISFPGGESYAISNQWGSGNIERFVERARSIGMKIETL